MHSHVHVSVHGETQIWRRASQDRAWACALVGDCQEMPDLEFCVWENTMFVGTSALYICFGIS